MARGILGGPPGVARLTAVMSVAAVPVAAVAAAAVPAVAQDVSEPPGRAVDRLFAPWDRPGSPGAAVGVFRDGEILFARGYGSAQLEWEAPITPATVFHAASVSKQFTAYAVALLAERGELSLDDELRSHLPELPDFGAPITLRHLLHHTSGLRDQWTLLLMAGWRLDDAIGQEDVLSLVRRQRELNFPPGEDFLYSNTGYTLLAEVVARTTGRSFAEWMRESVFEPLGMTRTWFQDDHGRVAPGRAASYERDGRGGFRRRLLSLSTVGATGLQTTVEDLARWAGHLEDPAAAGGGVPGARDRGIPGAREGGIPGAREGGIPGARGAIERMEETGTLRSGQRLAYALGQVAGGHRGLRTLEHGGSDAGFRSYLLRFPDRGLAVAVLANVGEMDTEHLARRVADLYLGDAADRTADRTAAVARTDPGPAEIRFRAPGSRAEHMPLSATDGMPAAFRAVEPWTPSAEELGEYEGGYWSEELEVAYQVRLTEKGLAVRHPRHGEAPLVPGVADTFGSPAPWLSRVRFLRDPEGRLVGFRGDTARVRGLLFVRLD